MHGFDTSIPRFVTQVRGVRIVVTPELIFDVLHVPWVKFLDYPSCPRLQTASKNELSASSVRHLLYGVIVKTIHAQALQKVQSSLTW